MGGSRWLWVALAIVTITFLTGCSTLSTGNEVDGIFKNYWKDDPVENITAPDQEVAYAPAEIKGYRIGSYNLEIFGTTKANNVPVVQGFQQVMNDYDILAVQEIRDKSETAFPSFMADRLPQYSYVVSERLGRTSSKEQYAFIWSERVKMAKPAVFPDTEDWFERPPYAAWFIVGNKSYTVIQTHIKPEEAEQEIAHLPAVVIWAEEYYDDDDIILLGDLNADCVYYDGDFDSSFIEIIDDDADTTTTRSDCAYDRIYTRGNINIIESGVDNMSDDGINQDLMEAMSDHFPIYVVIA